MAKSSDATRESRTESDYQNDVFGILSDPRRRFALQHLRGADTPVKVGDLAIAVTAREARRSVADRSGGDADAVELSLLHNHLPRMAEADVVAYDTGRRTVALADDTARIQSHLEIVGSD